MNNFTVPQLPDAVSVDELRQFVYKALQNIIGQLNTQTQQSALDMANQRIINVAPPAAQTDAATKGYVDQIASQKSH